MDSNDDMRHHHLHCMLFEMVCCLHCMSSETACTKGLVTWHFHAIVVIGVCSVVGGWLNDGCWRWWGLEVGVTQQRWVVGMMVWLRKKAFVC